MSDKGIIFSAPMVRALLDGRKTQTRRLLSLRGHRRFSEFGPSDTPGYDWHFRREDACWCDFRAADLPLPYAPGDRLYVRESCRAEELEANGRDGVRFAADNEFVGIAHTMAAGADWSKLFYYRGRGKGRIGNPVPSIHMPRWASRLWLAVTEVRVQRLQDISEADAIAEGVPDALEGAAGDEAYCVTCEGMGVHGALGTGFGVIEVDCRDCETAVQRYAALWNSLHTAPGERWEANPWVCAVSFDVHRGNIDVEAQSDD